MFEDHPVLAGIGMWGFCSLMGVLIAEAADHQNPSPQAEIAAVGFVIAGVIFGIATYFAAEKGYFDNVTDSLVGNSVMGIGLGVVAITGIVMVVAAAIIAFAIYVIFIVLMMAIVGAFLSK